MDEKENPDLNWKKIAFLRCPDEGCCYLEFPGCSTHKGVFTKEVREKDKKLIGMGCTRCGNLNTNNAEPFATHCRKCTRVKAVAYSWYVRETIALSLNDGVSPHETDPVWTAVLICRKCKTAEFPLGEGVVMQWQNNRLNCLKTGKSYMASDFFSFCSPRSRMQRRARPCALPFRKIGSQIHVRKLAFDPNSRVCLQS